MEYTCDVCNYKTNRSHNLKLHNTSVKHLRKSGLFELGKIKINENKNEKFTNVNNIVYECKPCTGEKILTKNIQKNIENHNEIESILEKTLNCICGKSYSCRQSLWKHKKTCKIIKNEMVVVNKQELNTLISEMADLKSIIKNQHQSTLPPININMTNNTTNNTNSNNNLNSNNILTNNNTLNMLSAIKYINNNYNNAQPLLAIESEHAKSMLNAKTTKDHTVEEFMIYHYDKQLFDYFIGEIIKSEYKKDNPKIQQFWATDVSRLSFVVRQAIESSDKIWLTDKKGVLLKKYIITPILTEVKIMVDDYYKYCNKQIKENCKYVNIGMLEKLRDASITCDKISIEIYNEVMHDLVLKYITPYFQLEL